MNAASAKHTYQNIKNKIRSEEEIGYDVISIALKKLETSLYLLSEIENPEEVTKPVENAICTIYILQRNLDLTNGSDLAKHLFQLYEFCRLKVIERVKVGPKANKDIKQCHSFIKEIYQSWEQTRYV